MGSLPCKACDTTRQYERIVENLGGSGFRFPLSHRRYTFRLYDSDISEFGSPEAEVNYPYEGDEGGCTFKLNNDDDHGGGHGPASFGVAPPRTPVFRNHLRHDRRLPHSDRIELEKLEVHFNTTNIVDIIKNVAGNPRFEELRSLPGWMLSYLGVHHYHSPQYFRRELRPSSVIPSAVFRGGKIPVGVIEEGVNLQGTSPVSESWISISLDTSVNRERIPALTPTDPNPKTSATGISLHQCRRENTAPVYRIVSREANHRPLCCDRPTKRGRSLSMTQSPQPIRLTNSELLRGTEPGWSR